MAIGLLINLSNDCWLNWTNHKEVWVKSAFLLQIESPKNGTFGYATSRNLQSPLFGCQGYGEFSGRCDTEEMPLLLEGINCNTFVCNLKFAGIAAMYRILFVCPIAVGILQSTPVSFRACILQDFRCCHLLFSCIGF